jgi:hypothetical protein
LNPAGGLLLAGFSLCGGFAFGEGCGGAHELSLAGERVVGNSESGTRRNLKGF